MIESIIKPLRPRTVLWEQWAVPKGMRNEGYPVECWVCREPSLAVFSAVEVAQDKDGISRGPEYHLSISKQEPSGMRVLRCTSAEAAWVLDQFELDGAEEDNHVPNGVARNFWRAVAEPMVGLECACKADETAIVEDKGDFVWRAA